MFNLIVHPNTPWPSSILYTLFSLACPSPKKSACGKVNVLSSGKSHNQTSPVLELHISGKCVYQALTLSLELQWVAFDLIVGATKLEQQGETENISKYRWSLLSVGVALGTALVVLTTIQELYRHGTWRGESTLGIELGILGGVTLIISFILAVVSFVKEEPIFASVVALGLSLASFLLYVR